jgi:hypothetical protein
VSCTNITTFNSMGRLTKRCNKSCNSNVTIDGPLGCDVIVSKRKTSRYRSGRSRDWVKSKNPAASAVKQEAEEDWGKEKWR